MSVLVNVLVFASFGVFGVFDIDSVFWISVLRARMAGTITFFTPETE